MRDELDRLRREAEAEGRRPVVGALIFDGEGRVFTHRRGAERRFLPGAWDIVGGHVEAGEDLLTALESELAEETGWRLRGKPRLVFVADWETGEPDRPDRREFDFLVEVDGDLGHPLIERPKHTEHRWISQADLDILDENRGADEGLVRRLVEAALWWAEAARDGRPHVSLFLDPTEARPIEALRSRWDPAMALQIPAHVTVAYPRELDSLEGAARRLERAAPKIAPFTLRLGEVRCWQRPEEGVYVDVGDASGGWEALRHAVLAGLDAMTSQPHITVVHPRTTNRGPASFSELEGTRFDAELAVREVALTEFDGRRWVTRGTAALGAGRK